MVLDSGLNPGPSPLDSRGYDYNTDPSSKGLNTPEMDRVKGNGARSTAG